MSLRLACLVSSRSRRPPGSPTVALPYPRSWMRVEMTTGRADSILDRTISEIARLVNQGEVSAEEVPRHSLERIERDNGLYGAFLTVQAERALDQARALDKKRASGQPLGPL